MDKEIKDLKGAGIEIMTNNWLKYEFDYTTKDNCRDKLVGPGSKRYRFSLIGIRKSGRV